MKRTQVTTNMGVLSMIGGFLSIYQNVKVVDFMTVFWGLTYGEVVSMAMPFIVAIWAFVHNEKK